MSSITSVKHYDNQAQIFHEFLEKSYLPSLKTHLEAVNQIIDKEKQEFTELENHSEQLQKNLWVEKEQREQYRKEIKINVKDEQFTLKANEYLKGK